MVIYLILLLPAGFSDLPKNVTGSHIVFCSVLLRMGFTCALSVTRQAVVSYTAFPPLPGEPGGLFLLHWPWSHLHRTLSGILPYEARTFLACPLSVLTAAITCLTCNLINITHIFQNCNINFSLFYLHFDIYWIVSSIRSFPSAAVVASVSHRSFCGCPSCPFTQINVTW